jgi:uncharacterized membrane protein YphA (DoxX/SURF4 family)
VAEKVSKLVWAGRVISWLAAAVFLFSGFMKLKGGEDVTQMMSHLGLPASIVRPLAILEISCAVIYLLPPTAVLGAILLAGYMGGAICTHWRVGDSFLPQIGIGVAVWLGLWLRESRLRSIGPVRLPSRLLRLDRGLWCGAACLSRALKIEPGRRRSELRRRPGVESSAPALSLGRLSA